jgi:DNA-binding transcriptional MerR regulator
MTQNRLNDLNEKIEKETISLNEVAEICSATLESSSKHSKDIKNMLKSFEEKLCSLEQKIQELEDKSNLGFSVILEDEED